MNIIKNNFVIDRYLLPDTLKNSGKGFCKYTLCRKAVNINI